MVDQFRGLPPLPSYQNQRPSLALVQRTMLRMAPESPEVRAAILADCQRRVNTLTATRDYHGMRSYSENVEDWRGHDLVAVAADDPKVQTGVIGQLNQIAATKLDLGVSYGTNWIALVDAVVTDAGVIAGKVPSTRKAIAQALMPALAIASPGVIANALFACEDEAYALLKSEGKGFGQRPELVRTILDRFEREGKTRTAAVPTPVAPPVAPVNGPRGQVPPAAPPADSKRPPQAVWFKDRYYSITGARTWTNAKSDAARRGARLATVPDKETNEFLAGLLAEDDKIVGFIGAELVKGTWVWTDGTPVKFTAWSPKVKSTTYKFTPYAKFSYDGEWFPGENEQYHPLGMMAIYEWPLETNAKPWAAKPSPLPPAGSGRPTDTVEFRGKHYKHYWQELSWHQARQKCEELGGRIAVVPDKEMNDFLMMLVSDAHHQRAWIGLTGEKGAWTWVNGAAAGYKNFDGPDTVYQSILRLMAPIRR